MKKSFSFAFKKGKKSKAKAFFPEKQGSNLQPKAVPTHNFLCWGGGAKTTLKMWCGKKKFRELELEKNVAFAPKSKGQGGRKRRSQRFIFEFSLQSFFTDFVPTSSIYNFGKFHLFALGEAPLGTLSYRFFFAPSAKGKSQKKKLRFFQ